MAPCNGSSSSSTDGATEVLPFTHRRVKVPTAASAGQTAVGRVANVWGSVGADASRVITQVRLPNGAWATSQVGQPSSSGRYVLELTYGKHNAGTQTFRVGAEYQGVGLIFSESITLTRS